MEKEIDTLQQQLKQQEKLASLGMLSAGIAHEIQNPLNFVINFSKMSDKLLKDLTEIVEDNEENLPEEDREEVEDIVADLKENLAKIVEHGERAISIIQGILLVSRGKENEYIPSDVAHIVKEYVWLSYHAMRANYKNFNISIHEEYQENLPRIMVIPQDLSRAILNLMNNACYTVWKKAQRLGDDFKPAISVKVVVSDGELHISIEDNGEGMTEEVKQRLYENFFTTKPAGLGTGLGMAITKDIIENKHEGTLTFDSQEGQGTTFYITIPIKKS
ncbi:MAG: HAMP domain-containing histidine kinase [Prevotella sp.]|nr:HAMP domain-containing histidine kinase [Prevotella sp.]